MVDKLYYVFYMGIKRGFGHAERASFLMSSSLFFYVLSICMLIVALFKLQLPNLYFVGGIIIVFGIAIIYLTSYHFVKTGRYRKIIHKYGRISTLDKKKRIKYLILILVIFLGAIVTFVASGIMMSQQLNY